MLGRVWNALRRMAAPAPVCVPVGADVHDIVPPRMPRERPLPVPGIRSDANGPGIGLQVVHPDRLATSHALIRQIAENRSAEQPRRMAPARIAEALVAWMQRESHDGWVLLPELEAALDCVCADLNVYRVQSQPVFECLASLPGVKHGRRWLNMPEFAEVKARLTVMEAARGRVITEKEARRVVWFIPATSADAHARLTAAELASHRAPKARPQPTQDAPDHRLGGVQPGPGSHQSQAGAHRARPVRSGYAPAVADLFDEPRRVAA